MRTGLNQAGVHLVAQFPEALELVDQGAAADAEGLGGFGAVEVVFAQGLEDGLALDLLQALGIRRARPAGPTRPRRGPRAGRCSGRISSPRESSAARSMALRSSRTLPGQA